MQERQKLRQFPRIPKVAYLDGKTLVEKWRTSVVGLIRSADKNLAITKQHLKIKNYWLVVKTASLSVENISLALVYCYGGKPNPDQGQEEALRMLSGSFKGREKTEFEEAVDAVARISHNRIIDRSI